MPDQLTAPGCSCLFKWTLANTLSWALGLIAGGVGFLLGILALMAVDSLIKLRIDGVSRFVLIGLFPGAWGGRSSSSCGLTSPGPASGCWQVSRLEPWAER